MQWNLDSWYAQRPSLVPARNYRWLASPKDWAGQPGTRAPHVWVEQGGKTVSTLDLLGDNFVLISGTSGWRNVAEPLALTWISVGDDVLFPQVQPFTETFGVPPHGTVLVRPDGIIAWRTDQLPHAGGEDELRIAFAQIAMLKK